MIDPARQVSSHPGVNDVPVIEREKEGVIRITRIVRRQALRFFPGQPLAGVLDNARAFSNLSRSKDTPPMNTRAAGRNSRSRFALHAFCLRHANNRSRDAPRL